MELLGLSLLVGVYTSAITLKKFWCIYYVYPCGPTTLHLDMPSTHEDLSLSKYIQEC